MAALLVSLLAIAGFALVLSRLSVAAAGRTLMAAVMGGLGTMLDREMDDDAKELAVRRAGFALLKETLRLGLVLAAALAAAAVPIYAADALGVADADATMALMLRVDYLAVVSVLAVAVVWLIGRWKHKESAEAGGSAAGIGGEAYGFVDRLYHLIAFSGPGFQKAAAWVDDRLFAGAMARCRPAPPIFVTSLARGGTTALLNAFNDMEGIATHLYRDMPFVTAPLLWAKLAGEGREVTRRARAHGDGLEIDLDSAEAFDEIFWMMFWPEHYRADGIKLWGRGDGRAEATRFFERQFCKVALLRRGEAATGKGPPVRYLSKNNANIARLRLLPEMFPGCDIVIPLRRPGPHAASLLRQHRNFLDLHARDAFTRRYMRDIGHLEFGDLHRPLGFAGFDGAEKGAENGGGLDRLGGDYWLTYWMAAFRDVKAAEVAYHLVTQEDLRGAPQATMAALVARLGIEAGGIDFGGYFRAGADVAPAGMFSDALLAEADALYERLAARAVR